MTVNALNQFRPKLHFAPTENWMNDPNGMVYFEGEYHLFFQHNPGDSVWGPMHWGHAVSKDMITWEELDIALYPDEYGTIFSGSAIIDWENTSGFFPDGPGLVAIFTHHLDKYDGRAPVQTQSLAYSHDRGRTWTKYEGNPVLKHESKVDFRDPKVFWHKETNRWMMALATGQTITFYSSTNLKDWQFESEFGNGVGSHLGVWECPDLFPLQVGDSEETKWVLLVSIGDNPQYSLGSKTQYFVGDFDGTTFTTEQKETLWLDFGKDNYAGVSFSDIPAEDGRRIYIGWMSNWRYANQVPTDGWRSQMTLPRKLSLRNVAGKLAVVQHPVEELQPYLKEDIKSLEVGRSYEVSEEYLELFVHFKNVDAKVFGLKLDYGMEHSALIVIDPDQKSVSLEREHSGQVDFSELFAQTQQVEVPDVSDITIKVIIDALSIELFINNGEYSLTSLVFPKEKCSQVTPFAQSGTVDILESYINIPK
ncbi:protein SacC [Alkalihalobacillus alcalophilus ATCC 27647 = CGMCC 1.3604]